MRLSSAVLALILASCSIIGLEHNDPPPVVPQGEPEGILLVDLGAPADGSPISVEESVRLHLGGDSVAVRGALFIDDGNGTVWLCQETVEAPAAPQPSCARPALLLQHPNPAGRQVADVIRELIEAGRLGQLQQVELVRWAEDATFSGSIVDPAAEAS